jgi:branched-chain amino acid transport system substrate-binding protein
MRRAAAPTASADKSPIDVQVFDTGTNEASAAAARAVSGKAGLILGPVFARDTLAVVAAAGAVPVISFSNDGDLVGGGAFVFGLTPSQSIAAIFPFARAQGVRRVSVVALDRPWGRQTIAAATALAPRAGLTIQQIITIGEQSGLEELASRVRAGDAPDAVLLADGGATLPGLAQTLAGRGIQILGTSQWGGLDLAAIPDLNGAWFAAPDATGLDRVSPGNQAGILPILALDGVTIALALANSGGISRAGLLRANGFATALGRVRFQPSGAVERDLSILGVSADGVRVLSKAPV